MTGPNPEALVGRHWLLEHLDDPNIVILEVDERPILYQVGHIPDARCLDWHTDLQDPVTRDIPSPQALQALWRRVGIEQRSRVVLYGDKNNWYACFAYWLFRAYGLTNLAILDGGRPAWVTNGLPTTTHEPQPVSSAAPLPRLTPAFRATWLDVADIGTHPAQLIDVRTPGEYRGEMLTEPGYPDEAAQRPGHIPQAINIPWDTATQLDGTFRPPGELALLFTSRGVDPNHPVITYCRIGERSAHTWFVLHELLGWPDVHNYDGSWTEWGSMIAMPLAIGDEPGLMPPDLTARLLHRSPDGTPTSSAA